MKNQKYDSEKKRWEEKEASFKSKVEEDQSTIATLKEQLTQNAESQSKDINGYREESIKNISDLTDKIKTLDDSVKQKEELYKTSKSSFDKEKAVLHQKIEFLELQLADSKNQITELKSMHSATLELFGSNNQPTGDTTREMEDLKETHRAEVRNLQSDLETLRKKLSGEKDQLSEKYNEYELSTKLRISDLSKEIENLKANLDESEQQRIYLADQNKSLEDQKLRLFKDAEDRYSLRIKNLELELEEQNSKLERDLQDINVKNEENLAQLRNFYEIEKERLERRITEEKDRAEKKYANLMEEYESRLREEQNNHEEELDNVKEELREVEIHNATITQQYEHELMLRQQNIETLEKYLKETKENLASVQAANNTALDNHLATSSMERSQFITRIENLTQDVAKKDREIFSLTQFKDQIESASIKKEAALEKARNELIEERNALNQKLEDTRTK